jgi:hypothetical protein
MLWTEYLGSSKISYVEILTPNVMILGSRAFGRQSLHDGINALIKRIPEILCPLSMI